MAGSPQVVLIDDDEEFCKILRVVLGRLGVELTTYVTPERFFEVLVKKKPDLVMVDLNFAELGQGFKIVERVRKAAGPVLPVLVITATGNPQAIAHALELGANDYLLKPVDKELLAAKLKRFVSSPGLEDFVENREYEVAAEDRSASVECGLEIEAVDEFGLSLVGPHMITKGTALRVAGEWIQELTGQPTVLVNVSNTWTHEDEKLYGAYGEFDLQNEELASSVRRWLTEH